MMLHERLRTNFAPIRIYGPDGSLWLADSEVDAITKVEIKSGTRTR